MSRPSQEWLDFLGIPHKYREKKFYFSDGSFVWVDGVCPVTKTIYEFLGDYWHGNPERFSKDEFFDRKKKITFGDKYNHTFQRFEKLNALGYEVLFIWESDFYRNQEPQRFISAS